MRSHELLLIAAAPMVVAGAGLALSWGRPTSEPVPSQLVPNRSLDTAADRPTTLETSDAPRSGSRTAIPADRARGSEPIALASTELRTRSIAVDVEDIEGRPVAATEVLLEALGPSDVWLSGPRLVSDERGAIRFEGLEDGAVYRVGATFPSAPAPRRIEAEDRVRLVIERPAEAVIELRSAGGHPLTGARRVELRVARAADAEPRVHSLVRSSRSAQWTLQTTSRTEAVIHVTDSLGRQWRDRVALVPGATVVATPGPDWIAVASHAADGALRESSVRAGRLRWSLRLGDRSPRRGSGRLAPHGGFHAVLPRRESQQAGGHLELRWDASDGERRTLCAWHPDPGLEHISLQASLVGEEVHFPTSRTR